MDGGLPTLDLLEATHQFPCTYMFKAIGRVEDEFADRVVSGVRQALRFDFDPPYQLRHTASGRHVSVTIEPWIESAADVLTVYEGIRSTPGLVMLW